MRNIVATPAPKPRSQAVRQLAWVYAALLTVMVVGQLFEFENFIPAIEVFGLPGGAAMATLFSGLIVMTQVFALPYLLGMPLSTLMRWVSLACGILVPIAWIKLALWDMTNGAMMDIPMFGTKLDAMLVPTIVALPFALVMLCTAIYIARGMWPGSKKSKKH
jgi:hypothetical protein